MAHYQLIVLGPEAQQRREALFTAVDRAFEGMGLDAARDLEKLAVSDAGAIDWEGIPVVVWCGRAGGDDRGEVSLLEECLARGNPAFPMVDDLADFPDKVPEALRPLNGDTWAKIDRLAGNLLHAYGLTDLQREAFISYKRSESTGVAVQLFEALTHRCYRCFLDSASIEGGRSFQRELKARLADTDLVVLLHTPKALDSEWVYTEIVDAQRRGTEILQVLWPKTEERLDMGFSEPFSLEASDLEGTGEDKDCTLLPARLDALLGEVERARIRSIRSRRARLTQQAIADARAAGLLAAECPTGTGGMPAPHISVRRPRGHASDEEVAILFPSNRVPSSRDLHAAYRLLGRDRSRLAAARVIYDELGLLDEDMEILDWLNQKLDAKSLSIEGTAAWLEGL